MDLTHLDYILSKLDNPISRKDPIYVSGGIVSPIEKSLLAGPIYVPNVPDNFPEKPQDEAGFREMKDSVTGSYKELPLRVGKIGLHLKDFDASKNQEAVFLIYNQELKPKITACMSDCKNWVKGDLTIGTNVATVALNDDGIITAIYTMPNEISPLLSTVPMLVNWVPGEMADLGWGFPYPKTIEDVSQNIKLFADHLRIYHWELGLPIKMDTNAYEILTPLVNLAVEAHNSVENKL
jgi:hypothetical protein